MLHRFVFYVIGNCDALSYYTKTLREDAQTAEMELIAAKYRGRARVLQAKLFVLETAFWKARSYIIISIIMHESNKTNIFVLRRFFFS